MDNLVSLYTSMEGRIGRKTWWLASIAMGVVILIIEFLILPLIGISVAPNAAAIAAAGDPAAASATLSDAVHKGAWAGLVIYIIFAWPGICLSVKRRHDRDNSGMDFLIFYALTLVLSVVSALGIGYTTMDLGGGVLMPAPSMPLIIVEVLFFIFAIYLFVVLGFLKGTPGTNQYGSDPLTSGAAMPA